MRRFIVLLFAAMIISSASAICDYGPELFDWSESSPLSVNTDWKRNEFGDPTNPEMIINNMYVGIDRDKLYVKFEFPSGISFSENILHVIEIYPHKGNVDYFQFYLICDELTQFLEKPYSGATINWTASSSWEEVKNNFNVSLHLNSIEIEALLKYILNPEEIQAKLDIYIGGEHISRAELSDWNFDVCSITDMVCGNEICEKWEDYAIHPCVCQNDCPDMDTTCFGAVCGNGWCQDDEDVSGSICECPEDCPKIGSLGLPCPLREPITNWANANELALSTDKRGGGNGTDLLALKSKVDKDNLYLKIDLESGEVPHGNISYDLVIRPWMGNVEYLTFKINCEGLYEILEKNSNSPSPVNYTSRSDWNEIKNNFTFATTVNSVEINIPWYAIYRPSSINIEARTYVGNWEVDNIGTSVQDITSLFVNTCGDNVCTENENDSYNRYQFCPQDCPEAPQTLWHNGVCDEGEGSRWDVQQWIWDCPQAFPNLDLGDEAKDEGYLGTAKDSENPLFFIILIIFVLIGLVTGISAVGKRILNKVTAGRRKTKSLHKRETQIGLEKKELQKKFMETRISETEFKEKMDSLEREMQNIHLELKKKKK